MLNQYSGLFLITGIMASGKSTVAQLLAEKMERSVHVRGDRFRRMIVNHRQDVHPDTNEEELSQLMLRYRLAAQTADTYVQAGFTVIVQDIVIGSMLNDFISFVQSRPFYIIVLCPNEAAVRQREMERSKKGYGVWSVSALDHILRHETPRIGLWLDSSHLTPEQTVEEILARAKREALLNTAGQDPQDYA